MVICDKKKQFVILVYATVCFYVVLMIYIKIFIWHLTYQNIFYVFLDCLNIYRSINSHCNKKQLTSTKIQFVIVIPDSCKSNFLISNQGPIGGIVNRTKNWLTKRGIHNNNLKKTHICYIIWLSYHLLSIINLLKKRVNVIMQSVH